MAKVAILGASRGLGLALTQHLQHIKDVHLFLSARRGDTLRNHMRVVDLFYQADFTNSEQRLLLFEQLRKYSPHTIFCVAGGGPYGAFETKEMKDHMWAYELNLIFPAHLLHFALSTIPSVKKIVFVGSAIADSKPDANAASYASAKHGLRGLVTTVREEQRARSSANRVDIRLFSPGYIDTDLLPRNAHPRQSGDVRSAEDVAEELWQWSQSSLD
jgi:short-subunit dehydrogenase